MLNKTRLRLILTNTVVMLFVVISIITSVYFGTRLSLNNAIETELIDLIYQCKRVIPVMEDKKQNDILLNQDLYYLTEQIDNGNYLICLFDDNFKKIYSYGAITLSDELLSKIAKIYYSETFGAGQISYAQDSKYTFVNYNYKNMNLRICISATVTTSGNLRTVVGIQSIDSQNNLLQKLLSTITIVSTIGLILCLVGGYYIAGRSLIPIKKSMNNQKQFIADASHELKTPLAVVKTNMELVLSDENETISSQKEWLDNISNEIKRMDKIVSDLLMLAKTDLDELPLEKKEIDLLFLAKDAAEKMNTIAEERKIQIICISQLESLKAFVDDGKITQLLIILLDNAIKYSNNGSKIFLYCEKQKKNAVLKVSDKGIGINKEDLENIFTRFYRVDKARSRAAGGSGLGLAIAKWIVDAHQGAITIESIENEGTTVIVSLPLNEQQKEI